MGSLFGGLFFGVDLFGARQAVPVRGERGEHDAKRIGGCETVAIGSGGKQKVVSELKPSLKPMLKPSFKGGGYQTCTSTSRTQLVAIPKH